MNYHSTGRARRGVRDTDKQETLRNHAYAQQIRDLWRIHEANQRKSSSFSQHMLYVGFSPTGAIPLLHKTKKWIPLLNGTKKLIYRTLAPMIA